MPKKTTTKMSEMGAAEFGTLLQDGKIIKMRGGKATIEQTTKRYGKETTTTFHLNLKPQIVHQEVEAEAAPVKAEPAAKKTRGRKAKTKDTADAKPKGKGGRPRKAKPEIEEDPKPRKRRARKSAKPKADKPAAAKKPGRKKRVKKEAPAPKAAPPVKKTKVAKPEADMSQPWGDDGELDDDDYEL